MSCVGRPFEVGSVALEFGNELIEQGKDRASRTCEGVPRTCRQFRIAAADLEEISFAIALCLKF
jgi:hypothetical protein